MSRLAASIFIIAAAAAVVSAQRRNSIEGGHRFRPGAESAKCAEFKPGAPVSIARPDFPSEARQKKIGGTVEVSVRIDENGRVTEVDRVDGNPALQGAAVAAAMRSTFRPSVCDGKPVKVSGVVVYNFIPMSPKERYFKPDRIDELTDIERSAPYFEAVMELSENYRVAFGYGDRRFYPDLPLTRGDFAHSLRLVLDEIARRAKVAGVDPSERGIFGQLNVFKLDGADRIRDLSADSPYSESVRVLAGTYGIFLVDRSAEFGGASSLRRRELNEFWVAVFGTEALPVNFAESGSGDSGERIVTRGEFAVFLHESMRILTYRLIP